MAPTKRRATAYWTRKIRRIRAALDQSSRDFLESAIRDYNETFQTNYDTSSEKFQNYYKDVSLRMKNREIDIAASSSICF